VKPPETFADRYHADMKGPETFAGRYAERIAERDREMNIDWLKPEPDFEAIEVEPA